MIHSRQCTGGNDAPALQRKKLPGRCAGQFGFTLVELVLVMIVIGVLAAIAVPKFADRKGFDAERYANEVGALVRYAQKEAIGQNGNVYVRLDGSSVALCYDAACTRRVVPAAGTNSAGATTLARCGNFTNWACEGVPNGLAMTAAAMFYFDPTGKPFLATDAPPTLDSNFPSTLTVRVTGDGLNHDTVIEAETGYVH